jgi:hypothetical protein
MSKTGLDEHIRQSVEWQTKHAVYGILWEYAGGGSRYYLENEQLQKAAMTLLVKVADTAEWVPPITPDRETMGRNRCGK